MADNERSPQRTSYGARTRRQMALIGLAGIAFELVVVRAALGGLDHVAASFDDARRISRAEQSFQNADQAHDALHADVLQAVLDSRGARLPVDIGGGLARDAAAFRVELARVDTVALPARLAADVRRLRPVQLRYVAAAEQLSTRAGRDPAAAVRQLPVFLEVFGQLERGQAAVTTRLAEESVAAQARATRDERAARWQILFASLASLVGLLGLAMLLHRLGRALAAAVARERGVAETLQSSLLPDALPELQGLELAVRYVPGGVGAQVGGDWYDVFPLSTGAVGLVIGDVAGHDLRAATVMAQLRHALRAYAGEGLAPGEVLERLNRLCLAQTPDEIATCSYAVLDPVASTLEVASAGHYAPMVRTPSGTVYALEQTPCPPVGAVRETKYPAVLHRLEAGSTLVMFTDGLVERRGSSVSEGLARLGELMAAPVPGRGGQQDLDGLCDDLLDGLLQGQHPTDDVALLVVRPLARLGRHLEVLWPAVPSCLVEVRRTLERWLGEAGADEGEVYDLVVAASEAATNAIEHAYGPGEAHFELCCDLDEDRAEVTLVVRDQGHWRSPRGRDRGRGLRLVAGLVDESEVRTTDRGTEVHMRRRLSRAAGRPTTEPARERVEV